MGDGRGLDNSKVVRQAGQTDVYTNTVKLKTSDPDGTDGWYVEWIRITMSTGEVFSCPVDGWLDNGDPKEPSSRTVSCASSGNPWLSRGKCGTKNLLPDGRPGQCDPNGWANKVGPCCSNLGWCGNSAAHCKCADCIDYRVSGEH